MEKHLLTPPSAMTYPYSPANSMTWESPSQMVPSPYQMTTSPYPMVPSPSQMSNSSPSPLPMYSPSQTSLSTFETDFMMKQESPLSPYDMSYTIAASPNLVLNRNNNYNESKDSLNNTTVLTKANSPTYFVTPPQSPPDNLLMNASQNMNADFEISNEYNKISAANASAYNDMKQMDHDLVSEFDSFFQQYVQVHSKSQLDTMNQCLINALNKPQVIKTENDSQLFAPLMDPKLENIQTQSSLEELVLQQITNNQMSSQPLARQTSYGNEEENEITTKLHNCIEHLVKNNNLLSNDFVPIESTVVVARVDRNPYNWGPTEIHEWARHAMVIWAVPKGSVPIDRFTNGQVLMAASREQFVSLGVPEKFIEAILALREWYKHQYRPSTNSVGGQNFEIKMEVEDVNLDQKQDVCNMIPLSVANHNQSNTGSNRNESNITDDHANQFINEMISDLAKCSNQASNHVQTNVVNDHSAINSFTNQNNIVVKYELDDTSLNTESSHNLNNDIRSSFYMGDNQSISKFGINSSTDPSFFSFNHTADATEKKEADEVPPNVPGTNGPGGRSHIQLWQFLKELLAHPSRYGSYIRWVNRDDAIFKIEDSVKVATLWGERKNRPHMNYDKLSRSIRQYYNKNIMKKTSRAQRLVYQFCKDYGA